METKSIFIEVKLEVPVDAVSSEVVSEMDYDFTHPQIVDTEIMDIDIREEQS